MPYRPCWGAQRRDPSRDSRREGRRTRVDGFSSPYISQKATSGKASASLTYFLANICAPTGTVTMRFVLKP